MKDLTPEQRKASAAKSVATRKANKAKQEAQDTFYKQRAYELKHGITELEEELESLRKDVQKEVRFGEAVKRLTSGALLREHEIVKHAIPITDTLTGVYFLVLEKRIVYVGQSTNVFTRILTHAQSKEFDSYVYIPCEKDMLNKLESLYIHFLSPPLNANASNGNKIAPLSLSAILY
jgi:hypothetical protein